MNLYHVAPEGIEGSIESLYTQHGEEAYEIFADRWPEAGELAQAHVHLIHCYSDIAEAQNHADFFGGVVVEIDADAAIDAGCEIETDSHEFDHPTIKGSLPESCYKVIA